MLYVRMSHIYFIFVYIIIYVYPCITLFALMLWCWFDWYKYQPYVLCKSISVLTYIFFTKTVSEKYKTQIGKIYSLKYLFCRLRKKKSIKWKETEIGLILICCHQTILHECYRIRNMCRHVPSRNSMIILLNQPSQSLLRSYHFIFHWKQAKIHWHHIQVNILWKSWLV